MIDKQELSELSRHQIAANIRFQLTDSATKKLSDPMKGITTLRNLPESVINNQEGLLTTQKYLEQFATSALKDSTEHLNFNPDEAKKQALELGKTYYQLGEHLSPLYTAFADWAAAHIRELNDPNVVVLFAGRDSLPFLVAFKNRYPKEFKQMYIPTNRQTLDQHFRL